MLPATISLVLLNDPSLQIQQCRKVHSVQITWADSIVYLPMFNTMHKRPSTRVS